MSPRLTSDYPERLCIRCTTEQRVNLITLAWFLGMEGKFNLSFRWFFDRFWERFYTGLTDDERAKFEELKERVMMKEGYSKLLVDEDYEKKEMANE